MWHEEVLPKTGVRLTEENVDRIGNVIRECLTSRELKKNIRKIREEFWYCIGKSAVKAIDYLAEIVEELGQKDADPMNQKTREEVA